MTYKYIKWVLPVISITLFSLCLTQDAFYTGENSKGADGFGVLLFGGLGIFAMDPAAISWLANPFLILSWVTYYTGEKKLVYLSSILAVLFAASFQMFEGVVTSTSGSPSTITGYGPGYWLWLFSAICMLLATIQLAFTSLGSTTQSGSV